MHFNTSKLAKPKITIIPLVSFHREESSTMSTRQILLPPAVEEPTSFHTSSLRRTSDFLLGLWDLGRRAPKHALQEPNCSTNDVLICSCDAFKITTLPVLDRPNSVQHLQARCRRDNYSLQLKRMIGTAKAVTSAHHFPTRQSSAYQATSISCHKRSIERGQLGPRKFLVFRENVHKHARCAPRENIQERFKTFCSIFFITT